jgi:hypothetical protein
LDWNKLDDDEEEEEEEDIEGGAHDHHTHLPEH